MSGRWASSNRRAQLPANWQQLRAQIGRRDRWECQQRLPSGGICGRPARDCDHINPGGSDEPYNLQMLCSQHHAEKSSAEGGRASAAALRELKKKYERPPEAHPVPPAPATKPRYAGF